MSQLLSSPKRSLYIVTKPNPYFKPGSYIEEWEDGTVQEVFMTPTGRPAGYKGLVMTEMWKVRPFTVKLWKRGIDFRKGGALG